MTKLRIAVIGVGHLGQIHARLLKQVEGVELAAVVDPSEAARTVVAAQLGVRAFADHVPLLGKIDAAVIATPSRLHYAVASDLLAQGIHVFVEKPMTLNVGDADGLIEQASAHGVVLQVGHVERFNPAYEAAAAHIRDAKYIDAVRSGPFTCRSTDIGVVLDLMIHDIDIALTLVNDDVIAVEALGAAVIGPNEDWAQARLTFASGCVANFFASRVSWQAQRSMHIISCQGTAAIDFAARKIKLMRISDAISSGTSFSDMEPAARTDLKDHLFTNYLPLEDLPVAESNPLLEEQHNFVAAIRGQSSVRVTGEHGRKALDVAERILAEVAAHRWQGAAAGATGPRYETRQAILRGPHWQQTDVRRKAG
ncbi:MAG: Gfo/Idh/MocA family oxidoreductase [Planctomycetia bacterium]|jgi:predicted dehydrogenase|nr:Gfo/Idh/MocA family oxidoreductase [Planctomycetia bacterium]